MSESLLEKKQLVLERGDTSVGGPLHLDLTEVYAIEARESETKVVNAYTANELAGEFNRGCGILSKYISWLRYEITKAEEQLDLAKACVILEVCPVEAVKLVKGLKPNDAWRDALIIRDVECQKWNDAISKLEAVKALLEGKLKTFERSYYTCYKEKDSKGRLPMQNMNGSIGMTFKDAQKNFMGAQAAPEKVLVDDDVLAALKNA
jgi:hypothetical protein